MLIICIIPVIILLALIISETQSNELLPKEFGDFPELSNMIEGKQATDKQKYLFYIKLCE